MPFCTRWKQELSHALGGQVETEEGVVLSEIGMRQSVPFVLPCLTGRGKQDVEVVVEIRLERFGRYMLSVNVRSEEVDVVLGVKQILGIQTVIRIVFEHQTFQ